MQGQLGDNSGLDLEDSIALLRLHSQITVLIQAYCLMNLRYSPLDNPHWYWDRNLKIGDIHDNQEIPQPTASEMQRLYRAFWRWHSFAEVIRWFNSRDVNIRTNVDYLPEEEILDVFFTLFPIHEIEELACLIRFARRVDYGIELEEKHSHRGPEHLFQMLEVSPQQREDHRIELQHSHGPVATIRDVLDAYERRVDGGDWPWHGARDVQDPKRSPTLGWTWASERGIQNVNLKHRRWGYVFWDQKRLEDWGITREFMLE